MSRQDTEDIHLAMATTRGPLVACGLPPLQVLWTIREEEVSCADCKARLGGCRSAPALEAIPQTHGSFCTSARP